MVCLRVSVPIFKCLNNSVRHLESRSGEKMLKRSLLNLLVSTKAFRVFGIVVIALCMTNVGFISNNPRMNSSVSAASLLDPQKITFQEIASGLTDPVFITNAGDGSGR